MEAIGWIGRGQAAKLADGVAAPTGTSSLNGLPKERYPGRASSALAGRKLAYRTCGHGNAAIVAVGGMRITRLNRDASKSSKWFAKKLFCESGSSAAVTSGESG